MGSTGLGCTGGLETCAFPELIEQVTLEGPGSIAYHVAVLRGTADSAGGGYQGTLTNLDPGMDAQAVLYRFLVPPVQDDLPGEGELMGERFLPAAGEHSFVVPIEGSEYWIGIGESEYGDPELDEWFVIEIRDPSLVEVAFEASIVVCNDGYTEPSDDVVTWERAW